MGELLLNFFDTVNDLLLVVTPLSHVELVVAVVSNELGEALAHGEEDDAEDKEDEQKED